ncbi:hypothetical protein FRB97_008955 [Tulasnella sp. 331]|nr:hypothetical protein FRB97_008955 [Tulasnella sp. 331]
MSTGTLYELEMVVKTSWIQEYRKPVQDAIQLAVDEVNRPDTLDDGRVAAIEHVLEVVATVEYHNYDAKNIRERDLAPLGQNGS